MIARRLGFRVTLLERGKHPRFAIGESASPLAGILIEQLSDRYDLPRLRPLSAFGTWQRTYPHVVCGLKRGFTYFKHEAGRAVQSRRGSDESVARGRKPERRAVRHALAAKRRRSLSGQRGDRTRRGLSRSRRPRWHRMAAIRGSAAARNATGSELPHPRAVCRRCVRAARISEQGARHRRSRLRRLSADAGACSRTSPTSHDATKWRTFESRITGSRIPNPTEPIPNPVPYPIDDAALHHVFDGGWMWVLRFGNGVTSAGVAVEDWLADELKLAEGEPAWRRLLARYPSIASAVC